jgi:plastocyanin
MRPVAAVLCLAALAVLACAAAARPTTTRHEIRMRGNSYSPRRLQVAVGDTVVWVNADIVRHDAVREGRFNTGELKGGERYAWVPTDTGTIRYECTIHERMRGTLTVVKAR